MSEANESTSFLSEPQRDYDARNAQRDEESSPSQASDDDNEEPVRKVSPTAIVLVLVVGMIFLGPGIIDTELQVLNDN
jgi:hypothetical protein